MKALVPFSSRFRLNALATARDEFERFLTRHRAFEEREALRFFRSRPPLLRLLAGAFPEVAAHPDSYAYELGIAGEFRTDFAFGNSKRRAAALIEFESGKRSGLLNLASSRKLSTRAAGGLSQLFSWAMLINDIRSTTLISSPFGWPPKTISLMYIGGRKTHFAGANLQFSEWLTDKIQIEHLPVTIITFDDLLAMMTNHIEGLRLTGR
jgi:hypothetical protein